MTKSSTFVRVDDRPNELVDTATGQRYSVRLKRAPEHTFGRRFFVIFDETMGKLARSLSPYGMKVLFALPERLDWRGWKRMPQAEVAEDLGISKSRVCRAMAELEKHGCVHRRGKGPLTEWRLARVVGYRGRASQFHADEQKDALDRLETADEIDAPGAPLPDVLPARQGEPAQPRLKLRTPKRAYRAASFEAVH